MNKELEEMLKQAAKEEYNELCKLVSGITFFEAYNKLNGYNLTADPITIGEDKRLIGMNEFFDVTYKHVKTAIFRKDDSKCEVWEEFSFVVVMESTYDYGVDIVY